MFLKTHVEEIKKKSEPQIRKTVLKRAEMLEEAYRENPLVREARVLVNGETIDVQVNLNLSLKDDEQNIVAVLEYGGVIIDSNDKIHEINEGFYIRRIMAYGLPR